VNAIQNLLDDPEFQRLCEEFKNLPPITVKTPRFGPCPRCGEESNLDAMEEKNRPWCWTCDSKIKGDGLWILDLTLQRWRNECPLRGPVRNAAKEIFIEV
jgi:hypothetical protein